MPGPLSAPNGNGYLTQMSGAARASAAQAKKLNTGKTAKKRGKGR